MDKNAIKKYAIWARNELIEKVTQKAQAFGIENGKEMDPNAESVNGTLLTDVQKTQRKALIKKIDQDGFSQVMEEVAYTWFNRFIAFRFMEVNGYLPSHVRVFTDENNHFKPQILSEALHLELDGLDTEKVYAMKEANQDEDLFKYLLIVQCNALNAILPGMFQKIADYTELLLPDYLLREGSVIERMVAMIPESSWDINEGGQVEILGWLYQYYISEKHEEVVDPLHGKIVKKEEVPAATQLFTTDWVVRYLIDNSVGRYWIERNPESALADQLEYIVKPKDGVIPTVNEKVTPQELPTLDPCVGSGHFLVYAFDVLMKIYMEYGYSERDAASEIVKNNLFGLDIDGRATQLAYFAVMMKARQYDRRFLTRGIQPHIYEITESNTIDNNFVNYFCGDDPGLKKDVGILLNTFKDAKEYGSILQMPDINYASIEQRYEQLKDEISMYSNILNGEFKNILFTAELMRKKYAVVATNPPYLNKFDTNLKKYILGHYKAYKGDLFSVFIYRNFGFCKKDGYSGFMTPMVWMFIKTYEPLRKYVLENKAITTLIQFEYSAFEEATVPICSFVLKNGSASSKGEYFRLSAFTGGMEVQKKKVKEAFNNPECGYFYATSQNNFFDIPDTPIAFWLSSNMFKIFKNCQKLSDVAKPRQGLATSDNNRFLRLWQEINYLNIGFDIHNIDDERKWNYKWFPCTKGGDFRRWYGNNYYVINWESDGREIKNYAATLYRNYTRTIKNIPFYFLSGLSWSTISSGLFSLRYVPEGFIFETKGAMCFVEEKYKFEVLALYNTCVMQAFLEVVSPTLDYHEGSLGRTPIILCEDDNINALSEECVHISKTDWDSFEISWDFKKHPLIRNTRTIKEAFAKWEKECDDRFNQLKSNEEELNRIFIDIYGLQDELSPEEEDKDVTVRKADLGRDIRSFISYAVGCMFGRYSLDVEGLVYAGGNFDRVYCRWVEQFGSNINDEVDENGQLIHGGWAGCSLWNYDGIRKNNCWVPTTFAPDTDNIIPITDDEYFSDDIVGRFIEFVRTVYGADTLEENLAFIADALGGKGTPREIIRNYFLNDFYKDHCKTYQKRPIYWLFDSGKKNGFKCLIYMHRYQPDTIARIRTDYVHEQQSRYRTAIEETQQRLQSAEGSNKVKLNQKLKKLQEQDAELHAYEEKIHHLADQMISIDLDDGVKHNYAIFQDVLAKIK